MSGPASRPARLVRVQDPGAGGVAVSPAATRTRPTGAGRLSGDADRIDVWNPPPAARRRPQHFVRAPRNL